MKKISYCITILLIATLMAIPVLADVPSTIPHAFYGSIYAVDGSAVPEGSIVIASVYGTTMGSITVTPAGYYGMESAGEEKLIVWDQSLNPGDTIRFYIDGVPVAESALFESGGVSNLTLTATDLLPEERPSGSSTMPVTSIADQPVGIDTDGVSVQLTTTEDINGEEMIFTFFSMPPEDQGVPSGHTSLGRFAHITSTITNDKIKDVILRFSYSASDLQGTAEQSIRVYWWDGIAWEQLPGGVDVNSKLVWGEIDHFSSFALFGTPAPVPAGGGGSGGVSTVVTPTPTSTPDPLVLEEEIPSTTDDADIGGNSPITEEGRPGSSDSEGINGDFDQEAPEESPMTTVIIGAGIVIIAAIAFMLYRQR